MKYSVTLALLTVVQASRLSQFDMKSLGNPLNYNEIQIDMQVGDDLVDKINEKL